MSVVALRANVAPAALALVLALAQPAAAQTPAFYALNESGTLSLNATIIDALSGSKWVSLVVDGSDRYALRDDGLVFKNGVKLFKLECQDLDDHDLDTGDWVAITVSDGSLWALSELGFLSQDGACVTQLDAGDFVFTALFSGALGFYSLRSDGAVYLNTTSTPLFAFQAGPGDIDGAEEGAALDTEWKSGLVGPDGLVYALRRDGKLIRGDILPIDGDPSNGTVIAELPGPTTATVQTLYADFDFTEDGSWNVLRGSGHVFREPNTLTPLIELDSDGQVFVDLLPLPSNKGAGTTDTSFLALARDGKLFRETDEKAVVDLPKTSYGHLALSLSPPDLSTITNALPVVAKYTVLAVSGVPVSFPILATDTDLAADELVVTVDDTTLPEGATFDDVARTIDWPAPVAGSFKIKVEVSDGVGKPVKLTFAIKVKDPDDNVDKNKPPRVGKIKNVQGLVGIELAFPVLATDPDDDTLTISVVDTEEPFSLGATFDPMTNVFTWSDPTLSDIGTYKVHFSVTDGTKTVKLTVPVKIASSVLDF